MKLFRFSLRGLLVAVAFIAFACAAVRFATDFWADAMFTLMMTVLLAAVLGIVFRRGEQRAHWIGFCVFGWGYLALVFGPWFQVIIVPRLLTSHCLLYLHPKLQQWLGPGWCDSSHAIIYPVAFTSEGLPLYAGDTGKVIRNNLIMASPPISNFETIGHSLFTLLFAAVGSLVASWFYRSRMECSTL
ncbi:MAG: hypothetical protein HY000_11845 [Planctomycetes bacterium]|nr:hypothetical protein [Planctomycetota bacterium]